MWSQATRGRVSPERPDSVGDPLPLSGPAVWGVCWAVGSTDSTHCPQMNPCPSPPATARPGDGKPRAAASSAPHQRPAPSSVGTLTASAADGRSCALRLAMCRRRVFSRRGRASLWSRGTLDLAAVQRTAATPYTEAWGRQGSHAQWTCPCPGWARVGVDACPRHGAGPGRSLGAGLLGGDRGERNRCSARVHGLRVGAGGSQLEDGGRAPGSRPAERADSTHRCAGLPPDSASCWFRSSRHGTRETHRDAAGAVRVLSSVRLGASVGTAVASGLRRLRTAPGRPRARRGSSPCHPALAAVSGVVPADPAWGDPGGAVAPDFPGSSRAADEACHRAGARRTAASRPSLPALEPG